ncbi:MAG: LD-carboxypeptidase [Rhodothermaceae bacterium]|nr:LD-carboxypeptidase [Rhodothermaceae bacterium]
MAGRYGPSAALDAKGTVSARTGAVSCRPLAHRSVPRPRPLTRQSRVAVAAPASAALDPADAEAGLKALRARGLRVETVRPMSPEPFGYLAGNDDARTKELNTLLSRKDLDAIFCLRGGYGVLRLLGTLDYDAARQHPKLVIGYSDITALHLALYARTGLPGLSGPMVAPDWPTLDAASEDQFWALAGGATPVKIIGPKGEALHGMHDGAAEGVLLGGNLTMVAALLGTPYLPDLTGTILFLEDVGEKPYQIDRLLARLHLAGVLERLGGLVFGAFTHAEPSANRPSLSLKDVLAHYARCVPGPVASGLVYGHFPQKSTLPVGVRASLEVSEGNVSLVIVEPVTHSS